MYGLERDDFYRSRSIKNMMSGAAKRAVTGLLDNGTRNRLKPSSFAGSTPINLLINSSIINYQQRKPAVSEHRRNDNERKRGNRCKEICRARYLDSWKPIGIFWRLTNDKTIIFNKGFAEM